MSCSEGPRWGFFRCILDEAVRTITKGIGSAHWTERYAMTFVGTSVWAVTGAFVLLLSGNAPHLDFDGVLIFALGMSIFFTVLIAISVKRGTPLRFFLLGLSIPTVTLSILKFAFLFGYSST